MKRTIVFSVIIALLVFYLVFGHNGMIKYNEMVEIQYQYEMQIKELDEKIVALEREMELLKKDNTYLEHVIRRELGLQRPDEEQYILPQTDNKTK